MKQVSTDELDIVYLYGFVCLVYFFYHMQHFRLLTKTPYLNGYPI